MFACDFLLTLNVQMLTQKTHIVFRILVISLIIAGCSTKKNTSVTRAYHEMTTRYNVFFNAQELYDEALYNQSAGFSDNYSELLPLYPFTKSTAKNTFGGPFDGVIEKTTKAIQKHSISAKPKRDSLQQSSVEYSDTLRQQEFNPFLKNVWLLMGKAHVQNQDYERGIEVFKQTINLFENDTDVVSEAQIWMMRSFTEIDRFHDVEALIDALQSRSLPAALNASFAKKHTHYLLEKKMYAQAVPYLIQTIEAESNAMQKRRMRFLLGQLYALLGKNNLAFEAFEKVKGLTTPYEVTLNAVVQQSAVATGNREQSILRELEKMTKRQSNEDFFDKMYLAIGNVYYRQNDTAKAVENYLLAHDFGSPESLEKAFAEVALGDIYFNQKDFVRSGSCYFAALTVLPKTNEHFDKVSSRSAVLNDLNVHILAVFEQDSIRHLAKLPHNEKLRIINTRIAELKKKDRAFERDAYLAEQSANISSLELEQAPPLNVMPTASDFYFDNPQLVVQGRAEFQRRWGNRSLVDNWRLYSKQSSSIAKSQFSSQNNLQNTDLLLPDFYLQQLPTTPEMIAASDEIIKEGLWNIGTIAVTRLHDFDYAIQAYHRLLHDYPDSEKTPSVYYQLYQIYSRTGNDALAQKYKQLLMDEYPDNEKNVPLNNEVE